MAMDGLAREVLQFWFGDGEEYGRRHKRWFEKDPAFDAKVKSRFEGLLAELVAGGHRDWRDEAPTCLAYIVVADQFSRNIFRGSLRAFAADPLALAAAHKALERGFDKTMLPVERLFFYLSFEHSETLADQELACELTRPLAAFPETDDTLRYAEAHRAIIARFGRFPHRNAILGRPSTPEEIEFLKQPGSAF